MPEGVRRSLGSILIVAGSAVILTIPTLVGFAVGVSIALAGLSRLFASATGPQGRLPAGDSISERKPAQIDSTATGPDPARIPNHRRALEEIRRRFDPAARAAFRAADHQDGERVAKIALVSASGAVVEEGDPRARHATAFISRSSDPKYVIGRIDVLTGEYTEQSSDEALWRLLAGL